MNTKKATKPSPKRKPAAKARTKAPVAVKRTAKALPKLRKVAAKCPHKPGTARAKKWACLRNGQSLAEARKAIRDKGLLTPANYIRWLEANGKVKFA